MGLKLQGQATAINSLHGCAGSPDEPTPVTIGGRYPSTRPEDAPYCGEELSGVMSDPQAEGGVFSAILRSQRWVRYPAWPVTCRAWAHSSTSMAPPIICKCGCPSRTLMSASADSA